MYNNLIWILIIGFIFGFISKETFDNSSWVFIFQAMQAVGAIAIPVIFFYLGQKEQKRKELQEQNRQDKENIENLLMTIIPEFPYKEHVTFTADDYYHILKDISQKLYLAQHYLRFSASHNKYRYLDKYVNQCVMFLMGLELYKGNRYIYDLYYAYCITYLKRNMQRYINQGYLDDNWKEIFEVLRSNIDQAFNKQQKENL